MKRILMLVILASFIGCTGLEGVLKERKNTLLEYNKPQVEISTNQGDLVIDLAKQELKFKEEDIKFEKFKVSFLNETTNESIFTENGEIWFKKLNDGSIVVITEPNLTNFVLFGITIK